MPAQNEAMLKSRQMGWGGTLTLSYGLRPAFMVCDRHSYRHSGKKLPVNNATEAGSRPPCARIVPRRITNHAAEHIMADRPCRRRNAGRARHRCHFDAAAGAVYDKTFTEPDAISHPVSSRGRCFPRYCVPHEPVISGTTYLSIQGFCSAKTGLARGGRCLIACRRLICSYTYKSERI